MKKTLVALVYSVAVLSALFVGLGAFAQSAGDALAAGVTDPTALLLPSISEISAAGTQGRWGLAVVLGIVPPRAA